MTHEEWVGGIAAAIHQTISDEVKGTCFLPNSTGCEHGTCACHSAALAAAETALTFVLANLFEPTEQMLEAGRKAWKRPRLHVSHTGSDEFMTCGVIHRAMIEASGLKP